MKSGAPDHPKMTLLAALLGIGRYGAVGLIEGLIHATRSFAPRGDIGRFTDGQIAQLIHWDKDPAVLIDALAKSGWLDAHKRHRFVVHDWSDHCEDAVHMRLARAGERFANGAVPRLTRLSADERAEISGKYGQKQKPPRAHTKRTANAQETHEKRTALAQPEPSQSLSQSHAQPEPPPAPENAQTESAAPSPGWLAGSDPAAMLAAIPIREPARGALVAAGITCEAVKATWLAVKREQLTGTGIADAEAVCVARLYDAVGLKPPRRGERSKVGSGLKPEHIQRMAQLKHNAKSSSG